MTITIIHRVIFEKSEEEKNNFNLLKKIMTTLEDLQGQLTEVSAKADTLQTTVDEVQARLAVAIDEKNAALDAADAALAAKEVALATANEAKEALAVQVANLQSMLDSGIGGEAAAAAIEKLKEIGAKLDATTTDVAGTA